MSPFTGHDELLGSVAPLLTAQYRIIELLGEGGMGQVYRAEHRITGQEVAIKALRRELLTDQTFRTRFLREAKVLSRFDHPSITHLYNFVEESDGSLYLVMQYVPGPTLEKLIERSGPLPAPVACTLAHTILDAFAYAHERGVIHRDAKPSNIVLPPEGGVKVMDFGIAHVNEEVRITSTGDSLGSPAYMAPEQVTGGKVDHRCDLYAIGVMLFEMVTGDLPFLGESGYLVMKAHVEESPPDPRDLVASIPDEVAETILWAMRKHPAERPGSAQEMAEALPRAEDLGSTEAETWQYVVEGSGAFRASSGALPGLRRPLTEGSGRKKARTGPPGRSVTSEPTAPWPGAGAEAEATLRPPMIQPVSEPPRSSPIPAIIASAVLLAVAAGLVYRWAGREEGPSDGGNRAASALVAGDSPSVIRVKDTEMVYVPGRGLAPGFYMDRTEVTNAQYLLFLDSCPVGSACGPSRQNPILQRSADNLLRVLDHPVIKVVHGDAQKYCAWAGKRLPTSKEWALAATGRDGWRYPWGNDPKATRAWVATLGTERSRRPEEPDTISVHDPQYYEDVSSYGIMGLGGNVSEWLSDPDPYDKEMRLAAGASWSTHDIEEEARCDFRLGHDPNVESSSIGFRCVMDPPAALAVGKKPLLQRIKEAGEVRVGTELDSPPMIYEDKDGKTVGFEYELMNYLADHLGVKLKVAPGMYPDFPARLRAGSIDLIVSAYTPDISYRGVAWSHAYLEYGLCLIVRADSDIHSVKDLAGKVIGHYTDAAAARAVAELVPDAKERLSYETHYLEDLVEHRIDAFFYDFPFAQTEIQQFKDRDLIRIAEYGLTDTTYNVGVLQGEWSLMREINQAIDALRSSDAYVELVRTYLGGAPPVTDIPPGARTTLVRPGDTLRAIAERELGDRERWNEIWELNRSRLGNQNLLLPNTPLLLPKQ